MAVCNGFDYVKVNEPNETISVAMRQCSTQDLRFCHVLLNHYSILDPITCSVVTCTEPSLSNGIYLGDHDGPVYQIEENIHAICQPGYTLVGPITRQCQSNGQWSEAYKRTYCELGMITDGGQSPGLYFNCKFKSMFYCVAHHSLIEGNGRLSPRNAYILLVIIVTFIIRMPNLVCTRLCCTSLWLPSWNSYFWVSLRLYTKWC